MPTVMRQDSREDRPLTGDTLGKRRRPNRGRACDICRQKKVRCDFSRKAGPKCSNCISFNEACTFEQPAMKKHVSPYPKGYADRLQARISQVEELLRKIKPDIDIPEESDDTDFEDASLSEDASSDDERSDLTYVVPPFLATPPTDSPDGVDAEDSQLARDTDDALSHLSVEWGGDAEQRFGSSSPYRILENALDMHQFLGLPPLNVSASAGEQTVCLCPLLCPAHPSLFQWSLLESEIFSAEALEFPPLELLCSLIDLYFTFYNSYLPVLHRQTFLEGVVANIHFLDPGFGNVVLLVCALGAKMSNDPRVLLEEHVAEDWHSAGWKWFRQVNLAEKSLFSRATLYDVQVACLSALYLKNTSSPDSSHICTALGLRLAQSMGAHRRRTYHGMQRPDEELLKRVFWVLVFLDWSYSSAVGRPSGIYREDIDLSPPSELDDEYWTHTDANVAFRQPPGVPCKVAFFNCLLRLSQIHAFTYRTLYSSPKARAPMKATNPAWEQRVVSELNAALVEWFHDIPTHLRWDPHNPSVLFLSQSATLYAGYYSLQIAIHRPSIPYTLSSTEPLGVSSLNICTTAAKNCVRVLDRLSCRTSPLLATVICDNLILLFIAGTALLIDIWRTKQVLGTAARTDEEVTDVGRIMGILKQTESHWHSSGRIWDMLNTVVTAGDISVPCRVPSPLRDSAASDERAVEELWLRARLRQRAGKRLEERPLIYHNPVASGIAAVEQRSRGPPTPPCSYNPDMGISPTATFNRSNT